MKRRTAVRRPRRSRLVATVVLVLAAAGYIAFQLALPYYEESPEARDALASDSVVRVTEDTWIVMEPAEGEPEAGLIFYPGARVSPRAYAPGLRDIAAQGYRVITVPMPLHLAFLGSQRAGDVRKAHPEIDRWYVGGHSLGGAMAAAYVSGSPDTAGLVLWAAYPGGGTDLSDWDGKVLVVSGSEDGLADPSKIEAAQPLLPPQAIYAVIEGGSHAQFGSYGEQRGDGQPTISRSQQHQEIAQHTVEFLAQPE